jgi:hypothetical protein
MALARRHVREAPPELRSLNARVPVALEAVVARTLAKRPEARPDAAELARLLAASVAAD